MKCVIIKQQVEGTVEIPEYCINPVIYLDKFLDNGEKCNNCAPTEAEAKETEQSQNKLALLDFSAALELVKQGHKIAREGWNGNKIPVGQEAINKLDNYPQMFVAIQRPDKFSANTLPYLYIEYPAGHPAYPNGSRCPWLASQTDMLADDWMVVQ